MFNEREALKLRLEQLAGQEARFLKLFREERELIFTKLRELDEKEYVTPEVTGRITLEEIPDKKTVETVVKKKEKPAIKGPKRGRKPIATPEKEKAIEILKKHPEGIHSIELKKAIEKSSGSTIANMTTFMKSVESLDPNVKKPNRGTYIYVSSNPILKQP